MPNSLKRVVGGNNNEPHVAVKTPALVARVAESLRPHSARPRSGRHREMNVSVLHEKYKGDVDASFGGGLPLHNASHGTPLVDVTIRQPLTDNVKTELKPKVYKPSHADSFQGTPLYIDDLCAPLSGPLALRLCKGDALNSPKRGWSGQRVRDNGDGLLSPSDRSNADGRLHLKLAPGSDAITATSSNRKGLDQPPIGSISWWRTAAPFPCPARYPELLCNDPQFYHSITTRTCADRGMRFIAEAANPLTDVVSLDAERGVKGMSLRKHSRAYLMSDPRTYPGIVQRRSTRTAILLGH
jgi:hypothetical protein